MLCRRCVPLGYNVKSLFCKTSVQGMEHNPLSHPDKLLVHSYFVFLNLVIFRLEFAFPIPNLYHIVGRCPLKISVLLPFERYHMIVPFVLSGGVNTTFPDVFIYLKGSDQVVEL